MSIRKLHLKVKPETNVSVLPLVLQLVTDYHFQMEVVLTIHIRNWTLLLDTLVLEHLLNESKNRCITDSAVGQDSRDGKFLGILGFLGFPFPGKTGLGSREILPL